MQTLSKKFSFSSKALKPTFYSLRGEKTIYSLAQRERVRERGQYPKEAIMVSINTNLSSLIVQNSLTNSTTALNKAIERMTTGFKINHASDNAAGYSIATNYDTKISAYQVAQDNAAMGADMLAKNRAQRGLCHPLTDCRARAAA